MSIDQRPARMRLQVSNLPAVPTNPQSNAPIVAEPAPLAPEASLVVVIVAALVGGLGAGLALAWVL